MLDNERSRKTAYYFIVSSISIKSQWESINTDESRASLIAVNVWDEKKILQNLHDLKNGLADPCTDLIEGYKRLMSPLTAGSRASIESILVNPFLKKIN